MTVKKFRSFVWTVFENIEKKSRNGHFLVIFGLILAMFPRSHLYDFDVIANMGPQYGVEGL